MSVSGLVDAELLKSETTLNFHRWLFYYVIKFNLVIKNDAHCSRYLNWKLIKSYQPTWNSALSYLRSFQVYEKLEGAYSTH